MLDRAMAIQTRTMKFSVDCNLCRGVQFRLEPDSTQSVRSDGSRQGAVGVLVPTLVVVVVVVAVFSDNDEPPPPGYGDMFM